MENNSQYSTFPHEESIDIKKYLFKFLSNWYWFIVALGITFTIAYGINRYSEPTYSISSSIIISDRQNEAASIESIVQELGRFRVRKKAEVVNEMAILKSYKMARMAIEELDFGISYISVGRREIAESKLYHNCPFIVIPDTACKQRLGYPISIRLISREEYLLEINDQYNIKKTLRFGETFETTNFKFKIELRDNQNFKYDKNQSNKYYFIFSNINSLAKVYRSKLNIIVNDEKGSILTLSLNGFVPRKMAAYLNKLSEVYIRSDLIEKNLRAENTLQFIDEQLSNIVNELNNAELKLQNFRTANQVFNLSQQGSLLYNKLNEVQTQQIEYEIKDRYFNYLTVYLKGQEKENPIVAPSIMNIDDPVLQNIVTIYNELLSQKNSFSGVANEDAPNLKLILDDIDYTLRTMDEYILTNRATNQITQQSIDNQIIDIENEIRKLPINERQLINIEREYKLNNELYTFLLEKRAEAGITKASNVADNKILDIARPENARQLTPKRSQNYMIALILGLGLPGTIILLLEFFNTKIEDKRDIERNTNLPIVGTIGHNTTQMNIPVFADSKSSLAESFRTLRTNLRYALKDKDRKVIMLTSTISGEGKTFAAVNLATIMAIANKKTLLVGFDLRKPSLHKIFNVPNEEGLSTMLIGQNTPKEIIKPTPIENLWLAPSGPVPPNPAELVETTQNNQFFEYARSEFDFIIIDTPPVAIVTDALLIGQYSDTNVFIVRQKYSTKQVFELINKIYLDKRLQNMSILVNDIKVRKYYGYSYGYEYSYGYGYGYGYRSD